MSDLQALFHYGSLFWALLSIVLLLVAWRAIRQQRVVRHKRLMILLTTMAWLFILSYLLRYRFPELNRPVPRDYILWFALHGTVALLPLVGASCLLFARLKLSVGHHFNRYHRYYGLLLLPLWLFTHFGGLFNLSLSARESEREGR